jgi:hypothetical protein
MSESQIAGRPNQPLEFYFAYPGIFFTLVSLLMAGLILVCRQGLYTPLPLVMTCLSIFIAAAFAPLLLPEKLRNRLADRFFVYPLASFFVLASPLLVWITGPWLVYAYPLVALAGVFCSASFLKKMDRRHVIFLLVAAPVLAVYVFLYFNQANYASVFAPEMALLGKVRKDTYYATSIAYMLQNFGSSSTGMDGLVRLGYHVGSHFWFASLGRLTGQPPLFTYPIAWMTIGFPAQFLALIFAIVCAAKAQFKLLKFFYAALLLVFITDSIGRSSHYVSESSGSAIIALLLFLPVLFDLISKPKRSPADDWLRLGLAIIAVFILISLKISVGFLWVAALIWAAARLYGLSWKSIITIPVAAILALDKKPFSRHSSFLRPIPGCFLSPAGSSRSWPLWPGF